MHLFRNYRESRASVSEATAEPNNPAKEMFRIQAWHRAYAQALIEVDPVKLVTMIEAAERAISARGVALATVPSSTDEILDLRVASDALSKLKVDNAAVYLSKFQVA
jgi:hypothetical protein